MTTPRICPDCHTEEIVLDDGTPCCMSSVRKYEALYGGVFPFKYSLRTVDCLFCNDTRYIGHDENTRPCPKCYINPEMENA